MIVFRIFVTVLGWFEAVFRWLSQYATVIGAVLGVIAVGIAIAMIHSKGWWGWAAAVAATLGLIILLARLGLLTGLAHWVGLAFHYAGLVLIGILVAITS